VGPLRRGVSFSKLIQAPEHAREGALSFRPTLEMDRTTEFRDAIPRGSLKVSALLPRRTPDFLTEANKHRAALEAVADYLRLSDEVYWTWALEGSLTEDERDVVDETVHALLKAVPALPTRFVNEHHASVVGWLADFRQALDECVAVRRRTRMEFACLTSARLCPFVNLPTATAEPPPTQVEELLQEAEDLDAAQLQALQTENAKLLRSLFTDLEQSQKIARSSLELTNLIDVYAARIHEQSFVAKSLDGEAYDAMHSLQEGVRNLRLAFGGGWRVGFVPALCVVLGLHLLYLEI
jgi:hypothetical protein